MRLPIFLGTVCALVPLTVLHLPAMAQADWPNKPARLIVAFPPGGSSDVVARQVAQHLGTAFGQQFIVENRSGAGGNIGTDAVAKAAPDGYTLGLSTSGPLANNKSLYKTMPFDAQKELVPIALVGEIPLVIAVNPAVKADNLKEFVALVKASPNAFSAGHPGNGTIGHLALEAFNQINGINLQMVPYKGDTPAMTDLLGGQIQAAGAPITAFVANIQAKKIRALAVTSRTRFPGLPNVPTAIEQGMALEATVWFAIVGPAGLPKLIVARLNREINLYTNSPQGRAQLSQFALVPANSGPEALGALMSGEAAKWKTVVETARISLD
jgi:tripartite-type tricarboxylate transporter receptor subunit TctC